MVHTPLTWGLRSDTFIDPTQFIDHILTSALGWICDANGTPTMVCHLRQLSQKATEPHHHGIA